MLLGLRRRLPVRVARIGAPFTTRTIGFLSGLRFQPTQPIPAIASRPEYDTVYLPPPATAPPDFPVQFAGLRVRLSASTIELCLVAEADAPSGMGGVIKINKNGTKYAIYVVETADPNASPVRVRTTTGTKAIRLKT